MPGTRARLKRSSSGPQRVNLWLPARGTWPAFDPVLDYMGSMAPRVRSEWIRNACSTWLLVDAGLLTPGVNGAPGFPEPPPIARYEMSRTIFGIAPIIDRVCDSRLRSLALRERAAWLCGALKFTYDAERFLVSQDATGAALLLPVSRERVAPSEDRQVPAPPTASVSGSDDISATPSTPADATDAGRGPSPDSRVVDPESEGPRRESGDLSIFRGGF